MKSECCLTLLLVFYLSCRRLGKLLGDVVISQGGVGEYRGGLFYFISDSFVQCHTLRLNFCQRRLAKERKKVKKLDLGRLFVYFIYLASFGLYVTVSLVILFRIDSKSCLWALPLSFLGCLTCNIKYSYLGSELHLITCVVVWLALYVAYPIVGSKELDALLC